MGPAPGSPAIAAPDTPPAGAHVTTGFAALRHHFRVVTEDPALGCLLDAVLAPLDATHQRLPHPPAAAMLPEPMTYLVGSTAWMARVRVRGETVALTPAPERLLRSLLWHVNRRAIASSPDLCLVHAAVVQHDDIGVMFPARMDAGKTTLAAQLLLAGYDYLSDEIAVVDPSDLRVHPYPKPLQIDPGSWPLLSALDPRRGSTTDRYFVSQWQVPAPRVALGPAAVRVIVEPRYVAGARTTVEEVPRSLMLAHLAGQAFSLSHDPRGRLATLAAVVRSVRCHTLVHDDLDAARAVVDELVERARVS